MADTATISPVPTTCIITGACGATHPEGQTLIYTCIHCSYTTLSPDLFCQCDKCTKSQTRLISSEKYQELHTKLQELSQTTIHIAKQYGKSFVDIFALEAARKFQLKVITPNCRSILCHHCVHRDYSPPPKERLTLEERRQLNSQIAQLQLEMVEAMPASEAWYGTPSLSSNSSCTVGPGGCW